MSTNRQHSTHHPLNATAHLLANFGAWWGFALTPVYAIGFALMTQSHEPFSTMSLPLGLPLAGLMLVLPAALCSDRDARLAAVVGLLLNAIPAMLAIVLMAVQG